MTIRLHSAGFAIGLRLTRLSLRVAGFRRTVTVLGGIPTPFAGGRPDADHVDQWVRTIDRTGGRPYGASCLDRSVFLWFLMRQRDLDGQIRIGVAFDDGHLDGHAWVESGGVVINDTQDVSDRFAVFDGDPVGIVFS